MDILNIIVYKPKVCGNNARYCERNITISLISMRPICARSDFELLFLTFILGVCMSNSFCIKHYNWEWKCNPRFFHKHFMGTSKQIWQNLIWLHLRTIIPSVTLHWNILLQVSCGVMFTYVSVWWIDYHRLSDY